MTRRLSRHSLACLLAWLLCSALYFGTAHGIAVRQNDRYSAWHHYDYLVDGFLAGHTHLSLEPEPELLALPDPYDPATNGQYRLGDGTLYKGHYYLYFGPTPVVALMLPWKLITGHQLPQWAATAMGAILGFGAIAMLLAGIQRLFFPHASPVRLFFAVVIVGHVSWLPVILRRPAFWELPIVTAVALFWCSLFFLWKYHVSHRRARWAFAAGCALALAPGARPTYAITVGFLLLLFVFPLERTRWSAFVRRLLPLLTPLFAAAIGLMAYNYLRFGSVFEFGQSYQLWGEDFRGKALFTASNIPINIGVYFFNLPEISPYFPFLRMAPMPMTGNYLGTEEMPGILFTMPAVLLGFLAIHQAYRLRKVPDVRPLQVILLGAGLGGSITGVFLFCFGGGCSRYITELIAGWSLLTGIGWLAWPQNATQPGLARIARIVGVVAVCWSLACVWFVSFEFRNYARLTQPALYSAIARVFNYPGHWLAEAAGREFGPVALDIRLSPTFKRSQTIVLHTGRVAMSNSLIIDTLAPERIRMRLLINEKTILITPVMQAPLGALIRVELHTPWLYPPTAHPYWNRFTDPVQRRRLQLVSVLATNAVSQVLPYTLTFDATQFAPYVHVASDPNPGGAWIENIRRLDPAKSIAGRDLGVDAADLSPAEVSFPH